MSASIAKNARIVAVPLTRPHLVASALPAISPRLNRLTYYQFQLNINTQRRTDAAAAASTTGKTGWPGWPREGIVKWASTRASDTWAGFGKASGGWKLKLYQTGESLVDRLDFEELALKGIDPSLGPTAQRARLKGNEEKGNDEKFKLPLLYPPSILSSSAVLSELLAYTEHRIPNHRRGFFLWMIVAPFTAPFMLIPIIPNIPFFFCAWRSWSHYKAYRSSQYLQSLLQEDIVVPEPDETLDAVYKTSSNLTADPNSSPSGQLSENSSSAQSGHELLLTREDVPKILKTFDAAGSSTAAGDLYRAVEQARWRVEKSRVDV